MGAKKKKKKSGGCVLIELVASARGTKLLQEAIAKGLLAEHHVSRIVSVTPTKRVK